MTTLVVVESPNKIQKVSKCLGPGFRVVATLGHFRDLPESELGVDVATWTPKYVPLAGKSAVISKLREALQDAKQVLLGTDADREGEAIAWHVAEALGLRSPRRIRFQELTPAALKKAVAAAGPLDQHLVDAQQARRVLDRLVGYQVSPLLSQFGPGHSAGRVQSATLHLVVEREKAREAFKPVPYWTVTATYREGFSAVVAEQNAKGEWANARFGEQSRAERALAALKASPHSLEAVDTKPRQQSPQAPFTTSTLQQAASAQLDLAPADTMAAAQALFEKGLITYHRTDSVALSDEAIQMARDFIARDFPEGLAEAPVRYKNADAAQEAHEAIRPTSLQADPEVQLSEAEETLYSLINRRFLASQCRPALLDVTTARLVAGPERLLAKGIVVRFEGFRHYLAEDETTAAKAHEGEAEDEKALPKLSVGQPVTLAEARAKGDTTKPPPRFTQATLVREMQRTGIGRPSTYANTVTLLFERRYLDEAKKAVFPTPRGRLVDAALESAFADVVATGYTAALEKELDEVAAGKRRWKDSLASWHRGFAAQLAEAPVRLERFKASAATLIESVGEVAKATGKPCPRCGKELLLRAGSKGPFLGCSSWPTCDYRADPSASPSASPCPKCSSPMVEQNGKFGRYAKCTKAGCDGRLDKSATTADACPRCSAPLKDKGTFLGCSAYPKCSFTVDTKAWHRAKKDDVRCAKCGRLMVERRGPNGPFLSCVGYPECKQSQPSPHAKKGPFPKPESRK